MGFGKAAKWKNEKLSYMDTDSIVAYMKTNDISIDNVKDVKRRIDTSNYELERPLPKGKKLKCNQVNKR